VKVWLVIEHEWSDRCTVWGVYTTEELAAAALAEVRRHFPNTPAGRYEVQCLTVDGGIWE
jgi:hypothetical protein